MIYRRTLRLIGCLAWTPAVLAGCLAWKTHSSHSAAKVSSGGAEAADKLNAGRQQTADGKYYSANRVNRDHADGKKSSSGNDRENHYLLGRQAEDAGQFLQAQQHYQTVIRHSPTHAHAHHRLGVVADKLQHYAAAKRHYQTALNYLSPDNHRERSIVLSDLGYSHLLQGNLHVSEQALSEALRFNSQNLIAWRNLGLLHGYRGDFQNAYQAFARAGGDADAQSKLDRLFPGWQSPSAQEIAGRPDSSPMASSPSLQHGSEMSVSTEPAAVMQTDEEPNGTDMPIPTSPHVSAMPPAGETSRQSERETSFPKGTSASRQKFPTRAQLSSQTKNIQNSNPIRSSAEELNSEIPAAGLSERTDRGIQTAGQITLRDSIRLRRRPSFGRRSLRRSA